MQFPLIGSAVLFGLYVVVKFVSKDYLDILISCYFALLGTGGLFSAARKLSVPKERSTPLGTILHK